MGAPLEKIVLEIFDLIEKHHPDIDVTSARTGFTTDTDTESLYPFQFSDTERARSSRHEGL
jgi:hypothetical protein